MRRIRHLVLSLPLLMFPCVPTLGADPPATTVLKEKGLTRSGRFFVIEAEKPVLEKWKTARAVLADYTTSAKRQNEADQAARQFAQLEQRRVELQQKLDELNQQINEQGFQQGANRPGGLGQGGYLSQMMSQRNMIRMSVSEIVSAQQSIKPDAGTDKKILEAESKKSLEAARVFLTEFRARKRRTDVPGDENVPRVQEEG
jgi:hypothetical protein